MQGEQEGMLEGEPVLFGQLHARARVQINKQEWKYLLSHRASSAGSWDMWLPGGGLCLPTWFNRLRRRLHPWHVLP